MKKRTLQKYRTRICVYFAITNCPQKRKKGTCNQNKTVYCDICERFFLGFKVPHTKPVPERWYNPRWWCNVTCLQQILRQMEGSHWSAGGLILQISSKVEWQTQTICVKIKLNIRIKACSVTDSINCGVYLVFVPYIQHCICSIRYSLGFQAEIQTFFGTVCVRDSVCAGQCVCGTVCVRDSAGKNVHNAVAF